MTALQCSYLGDAYYELLIRDRVIKSGVVGLASLHKKVTQYTSAIGQCLIMKYLVEHEILTEEEMSVYQNGKNAIKHTKKNVDIKNYIEASGLEALFGYLFINNTKRAEELVNLVINDIIKL